MLSGWFCRSMVQNKEEEGSQDESSNSYKMQYRALKRKLKFLIYENESFQETLRSTQRNLLKANRDCSFLLDRLLQYEKVELTSSESEDTESSDDGELNRPDSVKRKKLDPFLNQNSVSSSAGGVPKNQTSAKKKKPAPKTTKQNNIPALQVTSNLPASLQVLSDGHMTPEEVERHLESRQTYLELVPEKAPPTVPTEMFSNDPSLDSESNEICELETSPSNLGDDCLSIDMMQE